MDELIEHAEPAPAFAQGKRMPSVQEDRDSWCTPAWFFRALDIEFAFTFDAAASETNALCARWTGDIEASGPSPTDRIFANPPYSNIEPFVRLALQSPNLWVFILPTRMRAPWMERLRGSERVEFRWLRKRIEFVPPPGVAESSPRTDVFVAIVRAR